MTPYNHVGMRKFVRNDHMGRLWQLPALPSPPRVPRDFCAQFVGETHLIDTPVTP